MSEKMTDHYPRKKRRLSLTTNKNVKKDSGKRLDCDADNNNISPKTSKNMNCQRQCKSSSPGFHYLSSDESCLEIGWDNNSPSPTTLLRSGKKSRRRQKALDISTLLKVLPSKKLITSQTKDETYKDAQLQTWMQENLAVSHETYHPIKDTNSRRSHLKRSVKKLDARDFNEQLKKFFEFTKQTDFKPLQQETCRRSPRLSLLNKYTKSPSPNKFNNSQSDSFLLMGDFDELLIAEHSINLDKENEPNVNKPVSKTPKIPKSKSRLLQTPFAIQKTLVTRSSETSESSNNHSQCISTSFLKQIKGNAEPTESTSIEMDDELNYILSTQVVMKEENPLFSANTEPPMDVIDLTVEGDYSFQDTSFTKVKSNEINNNDLEAKRQLKLVSKRKNMSTPKLIKDEAGVLTTNELVPFDEDFMLDDLLLGLDDELKCKSQESHTSITEDQRKLKFRCHTSPFPLNNRSKTNVDRNDKGIVQKSESTTSSNFNQLLKDCTRPFAPVPLKTDHTNDLKRTCMETRSSFLTSTVVTDKCRRPFVAPKRNTKFSACSINTRFDVLSKDNINTKEDLHFPLELSAIKTDDTAQELGSDERVTSVQTDSSDELPLSSTQRCSYSEIERKRQEAQTRLKNRLRRKK